MINKLKLIERLNKEKSSYVLCNIFGERAVKTTECLIAFLEKESDTMRELTEDLSFSDFQLLIKQIKKEKTKRINDKKTEMFVVKNGDELIGTTLNEEKISDIFKEFIETTNDVISVDLNVISEYLTDDELKSMDLMRENK